ncbi:hypothetical protein EW026_g7758 [Hermanssonia centrifuga]|uniref:Uncharacterized protein n=1 Tax=Hermanssonia centrifuga TaxID=98765 RepID=A0A4S4K6Q7_9APHY|nr:hypothetical protein EW026_g7758 [Hermanssonia centrifuga]
MEKIFVGVVAGAADPEVVHAVRAITDFIYYAHFETHTEESLTNLEDAWEAFHKHKAVFVKQGIRESFNIPKLHSMIHYVRSIRLLGSADGYNTEGPERLHIDFAKLGYRASNRKQYVQQMTAWLERQEAVRRFEAYLDWLEVSQRDAEETEDSSDDEEPEDDVEIEEIEESEMATQGSLRTTRCTYKIAKKPPFPRTTIETIVSDYGASNFVNCLQDVVQYAVEKSRHPPVPPVNGNTSIPVFKQFKISLPLMSQVSQKASLDTVRAIVAKPARGRHPFIPAQFSTVLARESLLSQTDLEGIGDLVTGGNPLAGFTVGQVRVIFRLPSEYGGLASLAAHPLAYVEWFTPFQVRDEHVVKSRGHAISFRCGAAT